MWHLLYRYTHHHTTPPKPLDSKCIELDGHASLLICYLADQLQPPSNVVANQANLTSMSPSPTGLQRDNFSREPVHRVTSFSGCHVTVTEGATSNQSSKVDYTSDLQNPQGNVKFVPSLPANSLLDITSLTLPSRQCWTCLRDLLHIHSSRLARAGKTRLCYRLPSGLSLLESE